MQRPNIVLITCHDIGKHLNCYGVRSVVSPTLDYIAANGVRFNRNFATAPQCSPSRASLHTGRHAHANGMMGLAHAPFDWRMHPDEVHMAQMLRDAGYKTALIGVQHLTGKSAELGYDIVYTQDEAGERRVADDKAFFEASDSKTKPALRLSEDAQHFLRENRHIDQPFYLEVGFFEAHRPFDYGQAKSDRSQGVDLPPYIPNSEESAEEFAQLQGAIHVLDEAVGNIWTALKENGLEENTWLIVTTDHGIAMPRAKSTLFDAGLETTMLMHWPAANLTGGRTIDALTSHVDLVPTILDALTLSAPPNLQGTSYWDILQGANQTINDAVFGEKTFHTSYEPMRCIRTDRYKLIIYFEMGSAFDVPGDIRKGLIYPQMLPEITASKRPTVALYDLQTDPDETENLAGKSELKDIEQQLIERLVLWMQDTDDPLLKGPIVSPFNRAAMNTIQPYQK